MWLKFLFITILLYFSILIKNSFFVHYNILGVAPNFIFIIFFIFIFFSNSKSSINAENLFYSFLAGFFLDIIYFSYFGLSFILLFAISAITKKTLIFLKQKKDKYPISYFIYLFVIAFVIYELLMAICFFSFAGLKTINWNFSLIFLIKIIYNSFFAAIGFFIYKKVFIRSNKIFS